MIIHRLKASGFRIIGEPVDIIFPMEGRIGILGQNESGKTTLFQAIECALYGLKKGSGPEADRENLVTWGKNEAKLEIEFSSGQYKYDLKRSFTSNSHRATLTSIINGVLDRTNAITGLTDIENKIEQITGMDRDSFTKLVYIKQKDLDALKDMYRSKREQLINKVMGIEIFDDAIDKVKNDITQAESELQSKIARLESVERNKKDYETKLAQKASLENRVAQRKPSLDAKAGELENVKTMLAKYEWVSNYNSANEVECSLKSQMAQVEKEIEENFQLEEKTKNLNKIIETYKPEVTDLRSRIQELSDIERRFSEAEIALNLSRSKKQETMGKLGLSDKEITILSQKVPVQKRNLLTFFGATLIAGLVCIAIAFLTTIYIVAGAAILLAISLYFFSQFLKMDKLAAKTIEVQAIDKQIVDEQSKYNEINKERTNATENSAYKTSQDAQNRLSAISTSLETETGINSIEGIEALIYSNNQTLEKSKQSNLQGTKATLESQIKAKQNQIQELQNTKPASTDEIQYNKEKHEELKQQRERLQTEWNAIKEEIDNDTGTIGQLETDLEVLKSDFDLHPQLQSEVQALRDKIQLQKLVSVQISETSKELRSKVLPHASLIINRILPTLTSDRYSDFHITEDLKFTVYSYEAGGYKEREIFSGGTQDQFLIALRLAFTQSILDSRVMADKYSLLMDECTSSSDENRKQGIFEILQQMKSTFAQIFIIAHEEIATYVDNNIVLERNSHGYTEIKSKSWAK